jgi:hypothetical protein
VLDSARRIHALRFAFSYRCFRCRGRSNGQCSGTAKLFSPGRRRLEPPGRGWPELALSAGTEACSKRRAEADAEMGTSWDSEVICAVSLSQPRWAGASSPGAIDSIYSLDAATGCIYWTYNAGEWFSPDGK